MHYLYYDETCVFLFLSCMKGFFMKQSVTHSTAQHSTAQHSTAQHSTAQHSI